MLWIAALLTAMGALAHAAENTTEKIIVEEQSFKDVQTMPSVTVIGADKIRGRGPVTLGDLLREVAGVTVVRSGSSGQTTAVFIRGAESRHSLVLLDGLEVNDPSHVSRGFDFSNLGSENIERIEVYRGPQSVRFGSDAMGGVINIITKQGREGWQGAYGTEVGSYRTRKISLGAAGAREQFHYSIAGARTEAAGPSAADHAEGNPEPDASRRLSLSSRAGWSSKDHWGADLTVRTFETQNDLDYDGGPTGDDIDYRTSMRHFLTGAEIHGGFFNERLVSSLSAHFGTLSRDYNNYPDAAHADEYHEHFTAQTSKVATRQQLTLSEIAHLEGSVAVRTETSRSNSIYNGTPSPQPFHQNTIIGESLIYDLHHRNYLLETGARHDESASLGDVYSYSFKPGYSFSDLNLILRAGFSTGFKAPTLYQLHSSFGNTELKPEKSTAWEFSLEREFTADSGGSVTHFVNRYRDLIDYDTVLNKYGNIKEARSEGAEAELHHRLFSRYRLRGAYTHLMTEDRATGLKLFRRPQNSASLEMQWSESPWEVSAVYTAVSRRDDRTPVTGARTSLHSYDLVDLRAAYRLESWLQLRGRIENLFDRRYQESAGYGSSRLAGYFGIAGEF